MSMLSSADSQVFDLIQQEEARQRDVLEMIPSENYTSSAIHEAVGSVLMNKYSEGYPGKRYYQGDQVVDQVERLAQERAKKLFGVPYVNVQPYSGSPANAVIYMATLQPGDTIMGLALSYGGHLTHGFPGTFSGTIFKGVQYDFGNSDTIDFDALKKLAQEHKPKMIVASTTAYPRKLDFKKFAEVADSVGALLMADISHIAGLVVGGVHESPVQYVDIIMTTTHKTLRGPRGAMIMVTEKGLQKDPDLGAKIDKWIIPGMQGGPHDNTTAAIAVALEEASRPEFRMYAAQIVKNAQTLASALTERGFDLVTGGTDNHMMLVDLRNKGVNGAVAALALQTAGIVINKNAVPHDVMPPFYPSGIRIGTPAITTRGLTEEHMSRIADWIVRVLDEVKGVSLPEDKEERMGIWKEFKATVMANQKLLAIAEEVKNFVHGFPVEPMI